MKTTTKRLLSTLLVLLMVVTLLPTFAAADASVGDYLTATFKKAIPTDLGNTDVQIVVKSGDRQLASSTQNMKWGLNNLTVTLNSSVTGHFKLTNSSLTSNTGFSVTLPNANSTGSSMTANYLADKNNVLRDPVLTINLERNDKHIWTESGRTAATCETAGVINYSCLCGETKSEPIPALGHDWGAWTHNASSDPSTHTRTCARDASHTETGDCSFEQSAYTPPTSTAAGSKTWKCSVCGYEYTETIPATPNLYSLTYDTNGGTEDVATVENIPEQTGYVLNYPGTLTHADDKGTAVVFAGWTAAATGSILSADDAAPAYITTIDMNADKIVHAAWGYDANGDGIPDVNETKYTLTYDANGGDASSVPVDSHKYVTGKTVKLASSVAPTHADADGKKVVFAGWTAAQQSAILAKGDTAPAYITEATFATGNIVAYAAWSYDENSNGKPDVNEDTFSIVYDPAGGTGGPGTVSGLLPQSDYRLDMGNRPTHENANSKKVVFAGWTLMTPVAESEPMAYALTPETIYSKGEFDKLPALLTQVNITNSNLAVQAVYGYDEDGDDKPDVLQNYVTLTYNANGGEGSPAAETKAIDEAAGLASFTVSSTAPTRAEYSFKGWSTSATGAVEFKAGDTLKAEADITLYAVWEQNPLVTFTLTYDANGGTGAPAKQTVQTRSGSGKLVISSTCPTNGDMVFCGWSDVKSGYAKFQPGDTVELKGDVTLYALWVKKNTSPKTGDDGNAALWATLAALSVLGMGAAVVFGRKRRNN